MAGLADQLFHHVICLIQSASERWGQHVLVRRPDGTQAKPRRLSPRIVSIHAHSSTHPPTESVYKCTLGGFRQNRFRQTELEVG